MTRDQMIRRLARWCAVPSHAGAPAGQRRMATELARAFAKVAASVRCEPVGPAGLDVVRAWSPARTGRPVLLVGHYDTVPHDGEHPAPSVVIEDDRLIARGSADMKGGLVVMLSALTRLEGNPSGAPPWEVIIVPDEEIGTPWSRTVLADSARRACVALVMEPATPTGGLVRARKGVGTIALKIVGHAAHAGRNPEEGRSAIAAIAELVAVVEGAADPVAGTFVSVTTICGGSAANVVPGAARAQIDVRVDSEREASRVLIEIETQTSALARRRGVDASLVGALHRPPKPVDAGTQALFNLYRTGALTRGIDVGWTDVGGASDANLLAQAGIPVLDGLGVRGGDIHGAREYALLDSLPERATLLEALLRGVAVTH